MVGPETVRRNLIERLGEDWGDFSVQTDSFVAEGAVVVAFGIYVGVAKATGKTLASPFAHRWEVVDEKLKSFLQYTNALA